MSFATFADLKTNVRSAFNDRSDIPDFVYTLTTAELNSRLRVMQMESTSSLAVSVESTALPADFIEARHAYLDKDPRVRLDLADEFSKTTDFRTSGEPKTYTIVDGFLLLNPVPDGSYTVLLRYIAKLADFSADADTNDVLVTFPSLYFYGALWQAAMWEGDGEAAAKYEQMFDAHLSRVETRERQARLSAGPLRSRADSAP